MEDIKEPTPQPILDQLKEYAETRIKLAKYQAIDSGTSIAANIIADVVLIFAMLLAFLFISFTLAFYLSKVLDSYWEGFGCVSLLYIVIALVIKFNIKALEKPIINTFLKKFF